MYHHITTQKAIVKVECEVIKNFYSLDIRKEAKSPSR